MSFKSALDQHLHTIEKRDLSAFIDTVVVDQRLSVILPNGAFIEGFEAVKAFHEDWFSDPDWRMETTLLKTVVTEQMSSALLDVVYHDLDEKGQPYQLKYFLNLTFVLENGSWKLIFDQNTLKS